jgi:carbohydrate kinase (thermoresistant glucokinase family)
MKRSYIVMGVSGSGKSTIGKLWAEACDLPFLDADDFHPIANVKKMSSGIPLTDEDRWPWLEILADEIRSRERGCVLACSALKVSYRKLLEQENDIVFIYLDVSKEELRRRLEARSDHFMPAALLDSQFEALEVPRDAVVVNASEPPEVIINQLKHAIG